MGPRPTSAVQFLVEFEFLDNGFVCQFDAWPVCRVPFTVLRFQWTGVNISNRIWNKFNLCVQGCIANIYIYTTLILDNIKPWHDV